MAYRGHKIVQGSIAKVESLPAPVGGWNARDSLANMSPLDAVTLINMFPNVSNCVLRGGYTRHATGMDGEVQSLLRYSPPSGTEKLFAVVGTPDLSIFNVSSSGAVGAAEVSSLTNAYWEYANVSTTAGNYLYAVNGTDEPLLYDNSSWTSITAVSTPAITGVTTTALSNVALFKNRLWFIEKNTLKAWYLPTSSIGGAASVLDLSSIVSKGGYLVDMGTWTVDAGYGVDDNFVFVTSQGEIVVYAGTDPASADTWSLIGIWQLGAPIGNRCLMKWAGDLLVLNYDGLFPLVAALQSSRVDPQVALSDKIQGAISKATGLYSTGATSTDWQMLFYPKQNALWINVPVSAGKQEQYIMNTITKSWCQFQGWPANCWDLFNNEPYFGGDGFVGVAWDTTYADNSTNIDTFSLQAFNYFDSRGVEKYFTRSRLSLFTDGVPSVFIGMNVDFNISNSTAPLSFSTSEYGFWDVGKWDTAIWGQDTVITNNWQGITGIGYCGALQVKTASQGLQIEWASTDVVYQQGWAGV